MQRSGFSWIVRRWRRGVIIGLAAVLLVGWYRVSGEAALPERGGTVAGGMSPAAMRIACGVPTHRISELIYGVGYYPLTDTKDAYLWRLRPTARRWGGNHSSRYNFRLGNAWNTAADWYFRNVDYTNRPDFSWRDFLKDNRARGAATALTLPTIGWVAKDRESSSFPVSRFGRQEAADPHHPNAGNGVGKDGKPLAPGPPSLTSTPFSPEDAAAWVRAVEAEGGVALYLLDNEPELWHQTHRDVHPEPVGYDELLDRTVRYAKAVRRASKRARIAGPASWGWPGYFFSAKDQVAGFLKKPDRRAHGDVPLLAWYLTELRRHEQRTGQRLLDVLDVHFYPQEVPKEAVDDATRARRLRSTRALWDPTYKDESWIDDSVMLLPRMSRLIAENYPGTGLMIGEYNFGGEHDMSGALALAEALGRFGRHEGLTAAFYWTYPPAGSPAFHAFRAYRDYDGKGAALPAMSLAAEAPEGTSVFAAKDERGDRLVAVALNLSPEQGREAKVALDGCLGTGLRAFQYTGAPEGLVTAQARLARSGQELVAKLPPYSITVFEVNLGKVASRGELTPTRGESAPTRPASASP